MIRWAVVIPTDGERPDTLTRLVAAADPARCIIVHTNQQSPDVPGATNLRDLGPINIHRWWNVGIAASPTDLVAVVNDDITVDEDCLPVLAHLAVATGATITHPSDRVMFRKGVERHELVNILGSLFLLNRAHGVLPDERFRWWFGDNDLAIRALRDGHGIATTPYVSGEHHTPNRRTSLSPVLQALADADRVTFGHTHFPV